MQIINNKTILSFFTIRVSRYYKQRIFFYLLFFLLFKNLAFSSVSKTNLFKSLALLVGFKKNRILKEKVDFCFDIFFSSWKILQQFSIILVPLYWRNIQPLVLDFMQIWDYPIHYSQYHWNQINNYLYSVYSYFIQPIRSTPCISPTHI